MSFNKILLWGLTIEDEAKENINKFREVLPKISPFDTLSNNNVIQCFCIKCVDSYYKYVSFYHCDNKNMYYLTLVLFITKKTATT